MSEARVLVSRRSSNEAFTGVHEPTNPDSPTGLSFLTPTVLTYAGALPFVACALLPFVGIERLPLPGSGWYMQLEDVLFSYGLVIASFMAGTLWAVGLREPGRGVPPLLPLSNVLVLVVFISALAAPGVVALAVQAIVFVLLLWADGRLFAAGLIGRDYWVLRQRVTAIVVPSLLLGIVSAWPE